MTHRSEFNHLNTKGWGTLPASMLWVKKKRLVKGLPLSSIDTQLEHYTF